MASILAGVEEPLHLRDRIHRMWHSIDRLRALLGEQIPRHTADLRPSIQNYADRCLLDAIRHWWNRIYRVEYDSGARDAACWYIPTPRVLGWHVCMWKLIGSLFFYLQCLTRAGPLRGSRRILSLERCKFRGQLGDAPGQCHPMV